MVLAAEANCAGVEERAESRGSMNFGRLARDGTGGS